MSSGSKERMARDGEAAGVRSGSGSAAAFWAMAAQPVASFFGGGVLVVKRNRVSEFSEEVDADRGRLSN